jgi:drug/metabolite transporter (DMT)-like permease
MLHSLRGPLLMILATGSYVVNDTMMKLATESLPPYQTLMLRGLAAFIWGMPLLLLLGHGKRVPLLFDGRVLARNLCETGAILCFVVALANMPIADATALGQVTPLIVLIGASLLFGEHITWLRWGLIGLGFIGAILVAQPTGEGISIFAVLALTNAVLSAVRDLVGRRVRAEIPGMIVAISAVIVVLAAAAAAHLISEEWVAPNSRALALLAGSGFFLIFGHFFIFMAYRTGPTGLVAPFYYCFTLWAVISGLVVFQHLPNEMATAGIALVVASGLAIVLLDGWRRRLTPVS